MIKGFTRKIKPLEHLTEEEVESIHRAALFVMEKTGMKVQNEQALKLMEKAGCRVDYDTQQARIPPWLIEECIRKVPSAFLLKARDRDRDVMVGGDTVYFMQGMGMRYVDLDTWETRPATADEHRDAMIVADALENLHLAEPWEIYTDRRNVPPIMGMLENLASGIRYCSKTYVAGNIQDSEIFAIKMAKAVGADLLPEIEHSAPLTIPDGGARAAFTYMDADIPIVPALSVVMGGTGPATIAGAVTLQVAELMGWVVCTQVYKPGAPLAFHHGSVPMNMQTGYRIQGDPQRGMSTPMMNQMMRWYRIPIWSNAGFASNSKKIDYQTGYEKVAPTLLSALSGAQLHLYQGGSCVELFYSPELSVMDDDTAGWIGRVLEGATVNDETLAFEVINQVGPSPGHYLGTAHTREWWQKEQFFPQVVDVEAYSSWIRTGKKDMLARAREKVEEIVATHKPMPLTDEQDKALDEILREAREYFRDRGMISDREWADYQREIEF